MTFTCYNCKSTVEVDTPPASDHAAIICRKCKAISVLDLNSGNNYELTEEIFKQLPLEAQMRICMGLIQFGVLEAYSDEVREQAMNN